MTMILANVGLQIYNNWCGNRQNSKLQQKREEFEQAARERNKERMWKLMHEGQELTLELEHEKHQQRLTELKNDIGNLLQRMAYTATINNWPLSVLPIVMKNQALGNLLANQEESIAMHCIFTPSNNDEFNKHVFPLIEKSLEQYCNQHWSVMGDHPVLFYSGAWQTGKAPTEVQVDSMRAALSNLPTLLLTPFFRPCDGKLIFQLRMWGVGASAVDNVEFNELNEFEPTEFQRTYADKDDYVNETGLLDEIIEDTVPYLECLIGYMADTYFWSALGLAPCLPRLLTNGAINTDGIKYLIQDTRKYYENLYETSKKTLPFLEQSVVNLVEGMSALWDEQQQNSRLNSEFLAICSRRSGMDLQFNDINQEILNSIFSVCDTSLLEKFSKSAINIFPQFEKCLLEIKSNIPIFFQRNEFPKRLLEKYQVESFDIIAILDYFMQYCTKYGLNNISLLVQHENLESIYFHTYDEVEDKILYYKDSFNYLYRINGDLSHMRNLRSLFAYGRIKEISCHIRKIPVLKSRITSKDLIY